MTTQLSFKDPLVEILRKEFELKKKKNPAYSLRAFAQYLEMDPSNLSKILLGQLSPRDKLKKRLAKKLGLEAREIHSITDKSYHDFDLNTFSIVSDWYHFGILEILKVKGAQHDIKWISEKISVSEKEVALAIERLMKCGLLKLKNGEYTNVVDSSSSTLHQTTSKAHRNQQKQILEKAITAMEEIPVEYRSQSSMIMAIDREKLVEAKKLIKDFRRNLERFLSNSSNLNDVYHLSVSLYPVTKFHKENLE